MSILAKISEARRRRQAVRDLKMLSPEILLDIGIEPDRIDAVVSEVIREHSAPKTRPTARWTPPAVSAHGAWPYPSRRAG